MCYSNKHPQDLSDLAEQNCISCFRPIFKMGLGGWSRLLKVTSQCVVTPVTCWLLTEPLKSSMFHICSHGTGQSHTARPNFRGCGEVQSGQLTKRRGKLKYFAISSNDYYNHHHKEQTVIMQLFYCVQKTIQDCSEVRERLPRPMQHQNLSLVH